MNFLMKTHTQEETLETKVQQSLTACLLLSNFTSGLFFSSAIKVFGLVLYRMSVCLFRSQRSQASAVLGEPCTWERQCVADTFQRLYLSVLLLLCQAFLRATVPLGRGLETPPTVQSQCPGSRSDTFLSQPLCPEPGCLSVCLLPGSPETHRTPDPSFLPPFPP